MSLDFSRYLIRVIDDDRGLLEAMRMSLELDGWNVATYGSADDFLDSDDNEMPGCLILDYQMPGMNGIELQAHLVDQGVLLPIVFLSAHAEVKVVIKAFKEGACDFLLKPVDPEELTVALVKAIEKNEDIRRSQESLSPEHLYDAMTDQQKQVARLVAQNLTCAVIGERLGKSRRTIERHRGNVMRQLRVATPAELRALLESIRVLR
jgi:FixJ family two-component response regulator